MAAVRSQPGSLSAKLVLCLFFGGGSAVWGGDPIAVHAPSPLPQLDGSCGSPLSEPQDCGNPAQSDGDREAGGDTGLDEIRLRLLALEHENRELRRQLPLAALAGDTTTSAIAVTESSYEGVDEMRNDSSIATDESAVVEILGNLAVEMRELAPDLALELGVLIIVGTIMYMITKATSVPARKAKHECWSWQQITPSSDSSLAEAPPLSCDTDGSEQTLFACAPPGLRVSKGGAKLVADAGAYVQAEKPCRILARSGGPNDLDHSRASYQGSELESSVECTRGASDAIGIIRDITNEDMTHENGGGTEALVSTSGVHIVPSRDHDTKQVSACLCPPPGLESQSFAHSVTDPASLVPTKVAGTQLPTLAPLGSDDHYLHQEPIASASLAQPVLTMVGEGGAPGPVSTATEIPPQPAFGSGCGTDSPGELDVSDGIGEGVWLKSAADLAHNASNHMDREVEKVNEEGHGEKVLVNEAVVRDEVEVEDVDDEESGQEAPPDGELAESKDQDQKGDEGEDVVRSLKQQRDPASHGGENFEPSWWALTVRKLWRSNAPKPDTDTASTTMAADRLLASSVPAQWGPLSLFAQLPRPQLAVLGVLTGSCRRRFQLRHGVAAAEAAWLAEVRSPRTDRHAKKRGRQQPKAASQGRSKAAAARPKLSTSPASRRPWCWPCNWRLSLALVGMLSIILLGKTLTAIDEVAAKEVKRSLKTKTAELASARVHLDELKAKKNGLTRQLALAELQHIQEEAHAVAEKHSPGEATRLRGLASDAQQLELAVAELSDDEFPEVQDMYQNVLNSWVSTVARMRERVSTCTPAMDSDAEH